MSHPSRVPATQRNYFRNTHPLKDLPTYRMPAAALVSILHRFSGAVMFLFLPFIIWLFDKSISSEFSFAKFKAVFNVGWGWLPGWSFKLIALMLIWAYLHHITAGARHLLMDVNHETVTKSFGKASAVCVLSISLSLTFILGVKLFGVY